MAQFDSKGITCEKCINRFAVDSESRSKKLDVRGHVYNKKQGQVCILDFSLDEIQKMFPDGF